MQNRWPGVKNHLYTNHKISVKFSDKQHNYYTAFTYIRKSNENLYTSQGHPNLKEISSSQIKQYINTYCKKSKEKKRAANNEQSNEQQYEQNCKNKKPCRLPNWDVSEFMVENNIKSETELFTIADEQKKARKKEHAHFVLSGTTKALSHLLEYTWKMESESKKSF